MNLKQKIKNSGIKQKKIAEKLNLSPEYFNQMLNGHVAMSADIEIKVNELLLKITL